ncbi:hypothetical protein Bca4012_090034 [Brassica carinata]
MLSNPAQYRESVKSTFLLGFLASCKIRGSLTVLKFLERRPLVRDLNSCDPLQPQYKKENRRPANSNMLLKRTYLTPPPSKSITASPVYYDERRFSYKDDKSGTITEVLAEDGKLASVNTGHRYKNLDQERNSKRNQTTVTGRL